MEGGVWVSWLTSHERVGRAVLYPEGVTRHSPGLRSAPLGTKVSLSPEP